MSSQSPTGEHRLSITLARSLLEWEAVWAPSSTCLTGIPASVSLPPSASLQVFTLTLAPVPSQFGDHATSKALRLC